MVVRGLAEARRKRVRQPPFRSNLLLILVASCVAPLRGSFLAPRPNKKRSTACWSWWRSPRIASSDRSSSRPSTTVVARSSPSSTFEADSRQTIGPLEVQSPLSMSIKELADGAFGGRTHPARTLWKSCYRVGILDPPGDDDDTVGTGANANANANADADADEEHGGGGGGDPRVVPRLGRQSLRQLHEFLVQCGSSLSPSSSSSSRRLLRGSVADLAAVSTSGDGTTKLLIQLPRDGQRVETVIIPWRKEDSGHDDNKFELSAQQGSDETVLVGSTRRSGYSTLCVSSQVGCRQACSFCRTGMQGLTRSLTADEILAQVVLANSVILGHHPPEHGDDGTAPPLLPPIGNVVFMGMGEPADNARAVVAATRRLVDPLQFALPPRRVTVSTVAPTPGAFRRLLGMEDDAATSSRATHAAHDDKYDDERSDTGVQLAWSLHSSRNEVRKLLVPTAKYTVEELREGLIDALRCRSKKHRSVLIELTMLDSLNDSVDDAVHLAAFCSVIHARLEGVKVVVNLIPWNDIRATNRPAKHYRPSSRERVRAYQDALIRRGVRCYVRNPRGDDDLAACGQLSTSARWAAPPG